MSKRDPTEQEIRSRFIRPALVDAGWQSPQIREEHFFTDGRMHITGRSLATHHNDTYRAPAAVLVRSDIPQRPPMIQ